MLNHKNLNRVINLRGIVSRYVPEDYHLNQISVIWEGYSCKESDSAIKNALQGNEVQHSVEFDKYSNNRMVIYRNGYLAPSFIKTDWGTFVNPWWFQWTDPTEVD